MLKRVMFVFLPVASCFLVAPRGIGKTGLASRGPSHVATSTITLDVYPFLIVESIQY